MGLTRKAFHESALERTAAARTGLLGIRRIVRGVVNVFATGGAFAALAADLQLTLLALHGSDSVTDFLDDFSEA